MVDVRLSNPSHVPLVLCQREKDLFFSCGAVLPVAVTAVTGWVILAPGSAALSLPCPGCSSSANVSRRLHNKGATDEAVKQPHRMQRHKGSFWLETSLESPKIIWAELPTTIRKCLCFKSEHFFTSGAGAGPWAICRHSDEHRLSPPAHCARLQHSHASLRACWCL